MNKILWLTTLALLPCAGSTDERHVDGVAAPAAVRQRVASNMSVTAGSLQPMCIQPIFVRDSPTDTHPTGAAYVIGRKEAETQWTKKAGIVFTWREPRFVDDPAFKVVTVGDQEAKLLATVQDAGCIEVFFIQDFNPPRSHGGASTWESGKPDAQIIISDASVTAPGPGHDTVFLAHELGHVMGLGHPVMPLGLIPSSTNTLMCVSDLGVPRPARNSQENVDNARKALKGFKLVPPSAPPDCKASADCGPCPE